MRSIKTTRAIGFVIDYVIWYLLMYVMILVYFFLVEKHTAFSGDISAYGEIFTQIMGKQSFLLIYIGALLIYELLIPLCFGGQSISKKILKTEIVPFRVSTVLVRGLLKLIIINPCGVVSYLIASLIGGSAAIISDGLWIILFINVVLVLMNKSTLYDLVNKTSVQYKLVGEK